MFVYYRRKKDGVVIDVPKDRSETLAKNPDFELVYEPKHEIKHQPNLIKSNKKRFVYVANHGNVGDDDTEGHIARALESLGHEVIKVQQEPNLTSVPDGDFLLFHKWIPRVDFSGKKVCWYFDKVNFLDREPFMDIVVGLADYIFATDGDWVKKQDKDNIICVRQGVGYDNLLADKIDCPDVVYTGALYADRQGWADRLKKRYGDRFQVYHNKFGKELNDLCVSAKITLAPQWPATDAYWSNRVYNSIGRGAFMIHPHCADMDLEGLVMYKDEDDMYEKIDYYLAHEDEREELRAKLVEDVQENHTYYTSVKKLCGHLTKKN